MDAISDLIMDKSNWVTGAVALGVFLTVLTLMNGVMRGASLDKRMKAVAGRREELRRRSREAMATPGALRQADDGFKKRIVERLNLTKLLEDPQVAAKKLQAGLRGPRPLTTFYFFRFASPLILVALSFVYLEFINDFGMAPFQKLAAVMVFAAIGFYAPNIYV
ncbi:MAG: type II secretion system F family protein, partial [Brevundimonas sp.]